MDRFDFAEDLSRLYPALKPFPWCSHVPTGSHVRGFHRCRFQRRMDGSASFRSRLDLLPGAARKLSQFRKCTQRIDMIRTLEP
jgi:hypothetical protein